MPISRHVLHCLLVDYKQSSQGFFRSSSKIRLAIEKLRGDLRQHNREKYHRMYQNLDEQEMAELIQELYTYIAANKVSDLSDIDHLMIHKLMCDSLIGYELDTNAYDSFRKVVSAYFFKLNRELHSEEKQSLTPLNIWLKHVIDNPSLYIGHIFVAGNGNEYSFEQLDLSECGCVDVSHDRRLSDVRLEVEKQVLQYAEKSPTSAKKPLKILSLGSGGGLQDFIIIFKLLSRGIRNIELSLVETSYGSLLDPEEKYVQIWQKEWRQGETLPSRYLISQQSNLYAIIRALSLLARSFNDAHLTVHQYPSVNSLKKDRRRNHYFDVIHAIDFEDYGPPDSKAYQDFHALADCLSPEGTAILSHHYCIEQFKSGKEKDEMHLNKIKVTEFKPIVPEAGSYNHRHSLQSFF